MDFVTGLPRSVKKNDAVWVIVDRLTKSAHFIPFRVGQSTEILADKYIREIVRLHGAPSSITSDRDSRFTSHYWKSLMECLGTKLRFSTSFHPQTDGQSERTIQILEDMLRACVLDFGGSWEDSLHLVEFSYNNSFQTSIGMSPFELLYGKRCRSPLCWEDLGDSQLLGPDLVQQSVELVRLVRDRLRVAQDRQKSYADQNRRHVEFSVGDEVLLKISPSRGIHRFGVKGKLSPRYVGPYKISEVISDVAYRVALPEGLAEMHDVFHVSQLRRFIADPERPVEDAVPVFQPELIADPAEDRPIRVVDRKIQKLRRKEIPLVRIEWKHGSTWEHEETMRRNFPELFREV